MEFGVGAVVAAEVSLLVGAAAAYGFTRSWYRSHLRLAHTRIAHLVRARAQANEMLSQARRQVEMLSKELEMSRRQRTMARQAPPAAPVAPAQKASVELDVVVGGTGFANTLVNRGAALDFQDTQPFVEPPPANVGGHRRAS